MRILTREYYRLRRLTWSYDLWPCRVDPRASSYDQKFYEEVSEGGFPEMHREFIGHALEKGMSRCPTREEIVEDYRRRHADEPGPCVERFPEDVLSMAADPRVLGKGIVSPEVFEYCKKKRREASEAADEIYGRWLWHVMEDLPGQRPDAQELALLIIMSCHRIEHGDGGGILLKSRFDEIALADACIVGTDPGTLSAEYCELHRDGRGWILETMNEVGDCDIRFSGFDIVRRHRHEVLRPGVVRGHAAQGLRLRDEGG